MSAKPEGKKKEAKPASSKPAAAATTAVAAPPKAEAEKSGTTAAPAAAAKDASKKQGQKGPASSSVKRNVKPDPATRDAELEVIASTFAMTKAERDEAARKIRELKEANKGGTEERQKLKQELDRIKEELVKVRGEKDVLINSQKAAIQVLELKQAEERKAKEGMGKLASAEAIDAEIEKIEKRMTSSNFTAKEEKDMIREMEKLSASKKNIGVLTTKTQEVVKAKEARREIESRLTEQRSIVDEVQRRFQAVRDALTALDNKGKEGIGAELQKLREKHDALNEKLDDLVKKRREVYDEWKRKNKEFVDAETERRRLEGERRAAEQEKRRVEMEEQQKIFDEKRKAKEEEEAKKKPWEEEIALCDVLISYLQRLKGISSAQGSSATAGQTSAVTANAGPKRTPTDFGGLKPLVRDEDDAYIKLGAEKARKPARDAAKPVNEKKSGPLTHSIDTLNSFASLQLIPPSAESGIDASIAEVKEKRAYFDVLPRAPKTQSVETTDQKPKDEVVVEPKKSQKKGPPSTPSSAPSVQDSALFPHLPGAKPTSEANESRQKWGPRPSADGNGIMADDEIEIENGGEKDEEDEKMEGA